MKRLGILRHAKSSWDDPRLDDFNRPLNERGRTAARLMGRELTRRDIRFDLVVASPAARVRETIDGIREHNDFAAPVRFEPRIYDAGEQTLLSLVQALPASVKAALLVGHNPGFQQIVDVLSREDATGFRARVAVKFPAGAFALLELAIDEWPQAAAGRADIVELIFPKEL